MTRSRRCASCSCRRSIRLYGLAELALKATPLLLCAVGIAIAVRANVWNIGAEGQLTMGAIAGGGIGLAVW